MAITESVHPRGCGEHSVLPRSPNTPTGSSPRVRGTLAMNASSTPVRRFIPAGAGNTGQSPKGNEAFPVHPRGCGEHSARGTREKSWPGSSPRVRGTRAFVWISAAGDRFIPAGAGNTSARPLTRVTHAGSSPRVRGTPGVDCRGGDGDRFIPAGAGNTHQKSRRLCCRSVHPRGCGEHACPLCFHGSGDGSSPRVRGTLQRRSIDVSRTRFIPAGAGNTVAWQQPWRNLTVHPRGCGEHALAKMGGHGIPGSSPRVRGTPEPCATWTRSGRFIPAGAGNTVIDCTLIQPAPVHPRGCGEHVASGGFPSVRVGSSPRVRGTHCRKRRHN